MRPLRSGTEPELPPSETKVLNLLKTIRFPQIKINSEKDPGNLFKRQVFHKLTEEISH